MIKYKDLDFIRKVYKKVKSDIYYSKNLIYKNYIVSFETSGDVNAKFQKVLDILQGDISTFEKLLKQMRIISFPKNVEKKDSTNVVFNSNCDINYIRSVNFFICIPVELLLIDAIWAIVVGDTSMYFEVQSECVFGNLLNLHKLYKPTIDGRTISEDVNFFKQYFYQYVKWKNNAFKQIKYQINNNKNMLLFNYDIKQFYYNYNTSFKEICEFLNIEYDYLSKLVENIYKKYQGKINRYRICNRIEGRYLLPIGLYSSRIISNIALYNYDKKMNDYAKSVGGYYGRYVDDMLFALPYEYIEVSNKKDLIDNINCNEINFLDYENEVYAIPVEDLELTQVSQQNSCSKLIINSDKIDAYFFDAENENVLQQIYDVKMLMSVSDVGYSIDEPVTVNSLINDMYTYKGSTFAYKISDLKNASLDKYKFSLTLSKLIDFYKNVTYDKKEFSKVSDTLVQLISNDLMLKHHQMIEKVYSLLAILKSDKIDIFYDKLKIVYEDETRYDLKECEIYKNCQKVIQLTVRTLKQVLEISFQEYNDLKQCLDKEIKKDNKKRKTGKWQRTLMLDKKLFLNPLKFFYDSDLGRWKKYSTKIIPYKINFEDICLYQKLRGVKDKSFKNLDEILNYYLDYNSMQKSDIFDFLGNNNYSYEFQNHKFCNLSDSKLTETFLLDQQKYPEQGLNESDEEYSQRFIKWTFDNSYQNYKVGVASIELDNEELTEFLVNKKYYATVEHKRQVNHVLNEAIKNGANHIIFPELSIPPTWLLDLIYFSKRHNIQLTFGIQYLYKGVRVYNCIASIYPFAICSTYKFVYISLREKRFYPYYERAILDLYGLICIDNLDSKCEIIHIKEGAFTNFLCFELTNIVDRAKLQNKVNCVYVPVLNKDTNYFSNIVETTARELYSYVCMSNISKYGDSRITGPFKTEEKDIVKIKGGDNSYCVIGKIDLQELNFKRQTTYNEYYKEAINEELARRSSKKIKASKKKYKPLSAGAKNKIFSDF